MQRKMHKKKDVKAEEFKKKMEAEKAASNKPLSKISELPDEE